MTTYQVTYTAVLEVEADSQEQAIEYAIDEWSATPDGLWEAAPLPATESDK